MFLHLGKNTAVRKECVIVLCDMDNTTGSKITRDYLSVAEKRGELKNAAEDLPASFVVCAENGRQTVWLSQLSTATLLRRSEMIIDS